MAESFTTTNRFFDNKNYPRGFSRHGDFTIKEAQLLERHGYAFNELELGKREPVTEDEKQFVSVCRGVLWSNLNGHFDRVFSPRQGT